VDVIDAGVVNVVDVGVINVVDVVVARILQNAHRFEESDRRIGSGCRDAFSKHIFGEITGEERLMSSIRRQRDFSPYTLVLGSRVLGF
jgi:hypothetical protein